MSGVVCRCVYKWSANRWTPSCLYTGIRTRDDKRYLCGWESKELNAKGADAVEGLRLLLLRIPQACVCPPGWKPVLKLSSSWEANPASLYDFLFFFYMRKHSNQDQNRIRFGVFKKTKAKNTSLPLKIESSKIIMHWCRALTNECKENYITLRGVTRCG